jgi:DNA-binding NarL/FixJ family response regulator
MSSIAEFFATEPQPMAAGYSVKPRHGLNAQQIDILQRLCAGYKQDAIAADLGLTTSTIHHHCTNIRRKAGNARGPQLGVWAVKMGLVRP